MKMIEAHPSGSSCGASKESRTFSFWRLATESENCDFLNVPDLSKNPGDQQDKIDKHWQALKSIDKHWQALACIGKITCKSPRQPRHWRCSTSHGPLGSSWRSPSSSPFVKVGQTPEKEVVAKLSLCLCPWWLHPLRVSLKVEYYRCSSIGFHINQESNQ